MNYRTLISNETYTDGILDFFPNAALAYSLRRLRGNYRGFCIRVRRSSDNQEANIGFLDGVLNTDALLAFCENGNGYVTTLFSQDLFNSCDAVQPNASSQPQIVSQGNVILDNGKPALYFDGVDDYLVASDQNRIEVRLNTYIKLFTVNSSQQGQEFIFEHGNNANNQNGFYFYGSAYNAWIARRFGNNPDYSFAAASYWSGPSNAQILATLTYSGQGKFYKNGAVQDNGWENGAVLPDTPLDSFFRIFASTNLGYFAKGKFQELIVYNSADFSDRNYIESEINHHYNIF